MKALLTIFAAVFAINAMPAKAEYNQFSDGQALFRICTSERGTMDYGTCWGYILGAADRIEVTRAAEGKKSCLPEGLTAKTLVDLVASYLQRRPEHRHHPGAYIVQFAIVDAYKTCAD